MSSKPTRPFNSFRNQRKEVNSSSLGDPVHNAAAREHFASGTAATFQEGNTAENPLELATGPGPSNWSIARTAVEGLDLENPHEKAIPARTQHTTSDTVAVGQGETNNTPRNRSRLVQPFRASPDMQSICVWFICIVTVIALVAYLMFGGTDLSNKNKDHAEPL